MYPAGVKPGDALCLFASALILYASFSWSSKCHFFYMLVLFVGDLLFKMSPKCRAEVLSRVPKHKKLRCAFGEDACVRT